VAGSVPIIEEAGHISAGSAYCSGVRLASTELVVFAHQDVYLPAKWVDRLIMASTYLDSADPSWAVLGVFGLDNCGKTVCRVWSNGLGSEIGVKRDRPVRASSLDELVIVLRGGQGIDFDANLPGFHLYGTDIVRIALERGKTAYIFDAPVIHNSLPVRHLGIDYFRSYRYVQRKWRGHLPICTTVMPITRSGWPLARHWIHSVKHHVFAEYPKRAMRHPAPAQLSLELGYEEAL